MLDVFIVFISNCWFLFSPTSLSSVPFPTVPFFQAHAMTSWRSWATGAKQAEDDHARQETAVMRSLRKLSHLAASRSFGRWAKNTRDGRGRRSVVGALLGSVGRKCNGNRLRGGFGRWAACARALVVTERSHSHGVRLLTMIGRGRDRALRQRGWYVWGRSDET